MSPIDGVVLSRHHRGDTTLAGGTALLELGRMTDLEVVAEVLTEDALALRPGSEVELTSGLTAPFAGKVARIEPAGFTKLSTLGVEEQRVNVIVAVEAAPDGLGLGYRLDARFVTRRKADALLVPRYSVLQRPDGRRVVSLIDGGRLIERTVELGLTSERAVEVARGLEPDSAVVAAPESGLQGGEPAKARRSPR